MSTKVRRKPVKGPTRPKKSKSSTFKDLLVPWAEGYYRLRYEDLLDPTQSYETDGFMHPWPPTKRVMPLNKQMESDAEMCALVHKWHWRAVLITFCKAHDGSLYRSFTIGESKQSFSAYQEGAIPFLELLYKESVKPVNKKHIVAQAMILTPKGHHPLSYILDKFKSKLHLTTQDIEQLESLFNKEKPESKYFDTFNDLSVDQKLNYIFREMDMLEKGFNIDGTRLKAG